ncbi:hypothetical protein EsH8_I_001264 [Colletotrichum jinshuiense]
MSTTLTYPAAASITTTTSTSPSALTAERSSSTIVIRSLSPPSPALPLPFKLTDIDLLRRDCHVHGEWIPSRSKERFAVLDPGTGRIWATCPDATKEDVGPTVKSSFAAFQGFSTSCSPRERARLLTSWHHLILSSRLDLAKILVHETGKPQTEALAEVDYGASLVRWFATEAESIEPTASFPLPPPAFPIPSPTSDNAAPAPGTFPKKRGAFLKQPVGVVLALVPWSFPLAIALRKSAAALAAGCTVIVKPSSETPLTALALACLADRAGFPAGVLNVLTTSLGNTPVVSEALCRHPLVKARLSLDLGGNCPFIVFDDADLEQTARDLTALKWRHAGQACVAPNRCYVQRRVYVAFAKLLVAEARKLKLGHGMVEETTLGPLTTIRGLYKAEALCKDADDKGAVKLLGTGRRELDDGYFMSPTVLVGMTDSMLMCREEVFAPVLGLYVFDTEDEVA